MHAIEQDGDATQGDVVRKGAAIRRVAGRLKAESRLALEEQRSVQIVPSTVTMLFVSVVVAHLHELTADG